MSTDARNGVNSIPAADPKQAFTAAIDDAIEHLRRSVAMARDNGSGITAVQDREIRHILTP